MTDLTIRLDRESTPGVHIAWLAGPLDNRTADGFDEWLSKYCEHFGCNGELVIDMAAVTILSSRAISSIIYYTDRFEHICGQLRLANVPLHAIDSLRKLGLDPDPLLDDPGPPPPPFPPASRYIWPTPPQDEAERN